MRPIEFTLHNNVYDKEVSKESQWKMPWDDLVKGLLKKRVFENKTDPILISACTYRGRKWCNENVYKRHLLIIDYDGGVHPNWFVGEFRKYEYLMHSSFSNKKEEPRFRVIMPLLNPVDPTFVQARKAKLTNIFQVDDKSTWTESRGFYLPSCHKDNEKDFFCCHNQGEWIDLEELDEDKIVKDFNASYFFGPEDPARIASALMYIPADDYWAWFLTMCSLQSAIEGDNEDQMKELFHLWSKTSDKYEEKECDKQWERNLGHIHPNPRTLGSLFMDARQNGWTA